ncbi:hypothetical protein SVIOM342S_01732 [Streptomyces violaceorubidus]
MLAVVGLSPDAVRALLDRSGATDVDLADLNTATQVVVSGPAESVKALRAAVRAAPGARCVSLATVPSPPGTCAPPRSASPRSSIPSNSGHRVSR